MHYKLANAWIMINSKNGYNSKHVHGGCHLSGVLWIKSKKKSRKSYFLKVKIHIQNIIIKESFSKN